MGAKLDVRIAKLALDRPFFVAVSANPNANVGPEVINLLVQFGRILVGVVPFQDFLSPVTVGV